MSDDLLGMHRRLHFGNGAVIDQHLSRSPFEHDPCRCTGAARNPQPLRRRQLLGRRRDLHKAARAHLSGGPRWTRTTYLRVISTALCQLS